MRSSQEIHDFYLFPKKVRDSAQALVDLDHAHRLDPTLGADAVPDLLICRGGGEEVRGGWDNQACGAPA